MPTALVFIGIDPGLNGAVAVIDTESRKIRLLDTPTLQENKRKTPDAAGMAELLKPYQGRSVAVCLERVHAMPNQGVSSTFRFGEGYGIWQGIIATLGYPLILAPPQTWKREFGDRLIGCEDAKSEARALAIELYPATAPKLARKKDADRAEALLLAEFLRRKTE